MKERGRVCVFRKGPDEYMDYPGSSQLRRPSSIITELALLQDGHVAVDINSQFLRDGFVSVSTQKLHDVKQFTDIALQMMLFTTVQMHLFSGAALSSSSSLHHRKALEAICLPWSTQES